LPQRSKAILCGGFGLVAATRRERFEDFMHRLCKAAPFSDFATAWAAVRDLMTTVENELSGIPQDPNAHLARVSDGRMYPPTNVLRSLQRHPEYGPFGRSVTARSLVAMARCASNAWMGLLKLTSQVPTLAQLQSFAWR